MAKYSISSYTADGTTTDFLLTWDYLDKTHIAVYVDDVNVADAGSGFTSTLINSTTVRVTTDLAAPVPAGKIVELRRETPIDTQAVTFNDGSSLNGGDLNTNTDYLLYAMQEALDTVDIAAQNGAQAAQIATEGFRDEAEVFKDEAQASATSAAISAGVAQVHANNAANSESSAAADAAAALAAKNAAEQSEINAAGHELVAGTHATDAGADRALAQAAKTAAETAALNATTAANSAEAAWDSFDDRYLGSKASAPTLDNDGNALVAGALYWNTTSSLLQIYTGSAWENVAISSTTPTFTSVTAGQVNSSGAVIATGAGQFGDDVDVTGTVTADGLTVDGAGTITNTTAGVATALSLKNNTAGANNRAALDFYSANTKYVALEGGYGAASPQFNLKVGNPPALVLSATSGGDISFYEDTGTAPKFFWDASAESLGIGTTSPSSILHTSGTGHITIQDTNNTSANVQQHISLQRGDGSGIDGRINSVCDGSNGVSAIAFAIDGERMRIDSSGNLLVGTTSSAPYNFTSGGGVCFDPNGPSSIARSGTLPALTLNQSDSDGTVLSFRRSGTAVGGVTLTTSATSYNTSSDYRLKEDVQPMTGASQRVLALNPVNFAWKADGTRVDGFLAHEAQAVVPEAVTGTKDAVDDEGKPDYQAIDQSKLVPLLTAALQEALQRIEALEAQLNP